MVNAIDISCGKNYVYLCHSDTTICVKKNEVKAHLDHGDYLGTCANSVSFATNRDTSAQENNDIFILYPNPTTSSFTVEIYKNKIVERAILKVVDFNGHIIYSKAPFRIDGYFKGIIDLNQAALPDGIYFLQLIIGEKTETQKIILKK